MASGNKAVIAACIANSGIAVAKLVGYFITGAASMMAEAVHSFADAGNQALLLFGGARARREATEEHPFGYGRERYFWAFVVALIIFMLGSVYAIYEGVHKLQHPEPLSNPLVAVGILTIGLGLEGWSFRTAIVEANAIRGSASWWEFIRHTKKAELPVVLLEDLGALIGLAVALAGVGLATATGDGRFDAMGSIVIGVLLGLIAIVLAVEMQSLLVGESAKANVVAKIRKALEDSDDITRIIHMRTVHLGPDELLVAAKVELSHDLKVSELADRINDAEAAIRAVVPIARLIFLEPDVYRDKRADGG